MSGKISNSVRDLQWINVPWKTCLLKVDFSGGDNEEEVMLGLEIMLVLDIELELSIYPQLITLWIVAENLSCWGLSDVSCKVSCLQGGAGL